MQVAVIVPNYMEHTTREIFSRNVRVLTPGSGLMGSRFDYIILWLWSPTNVHEKQWFEESVRCRLKHGGHIITVPAIDQGTPPE